MSSVYVGVKNMERALDIYRELFEMPLEQEGERFSRFEFGTFEFGLYNAGSDGYNLEFGNNCIPNFEVDDIEESYNRIEQIAPEMVYEGNSEIR